MANLFTRPDTFFGVCEALGQDLGFNPLWLRLALAVSLLWNPVWVIAGYCAAGMLILALRLLLPDAKKTTPAPAESTGNVEEPALAMAA